MLVPRTSIILWTILAAACSPAATPAPTPPDPAPASSPALPDDLLDDLRHVGQTNALFEGQEARIVFGCTYEESEFHCVAIGGKLGPVMRDRVVKALGAERIKSAPNQAVTAICSQVGGAWSCDIEDGERPGSKGTSDSPVTE